MALPIALGLALGAFGGIANLIQNKQNADRQAEIADQNYAMQYDQNMYQRQLNELTMQREDNAVQRRVDDLMAAGIDPSLAAGSAASSSGFSAGPAPQQEFVAKTDAYGLLQAMQMTEQFAQLDSQINYTKEQSRYVSQQNAWYGIQALQDLAVKIASENNIKGQTAKTAIETALMSRDLRYLDKWNLPTSVHDSVKAATQFLDVMESEGSKNKLKQIENLMNKIGNANRVIIQNMYEDYEKSRKANLEKIKAHNESHIDPEMEKPVDPGFDQQEWNAYNTRMY